MSVGKSVGMLVGMSFGNAIFFNAIFNRGNNLSYSYIDKSSTAKKEKLNIHLLSWLRASEDPSWIKTGSDVLVDSAGSVLLTIDHVKRVIFRVRGRVSLIPIGTDDVHFIAQLR